MMNKITVDEAVSKIQTVKPLKLEHLVNIEDSAGHILSRPVYAEYSVPCAPLSAMDGFAVKSDETAAACENNPITLTHFSRVNTGNAVSSEYDSVIKVEDVIFEGESPKKITIKAPASKGDNVRATGEDIEEKGLILPAGRKIRAFDIGAFASYGITEVYVKSLNIGIIPTGTELIQAGCVPKPGEVVESNTMMTAAYLRTFGAKVTRYSPVDDSKEKITAALKKAEDENDIILVSAGSSMGSKDFTSASIEELGELLFHGVFMKPAKPSMFGLINGKPVFGMPGFPLSAQTTIRVMVSKLLNSWGWFGEEFVSVSAEAGEIIKSDEMIDEFSIVTVGNVFGKNVVLPQFRASSIQMNGIRSNAVVRIPRGCAKLNKGDIISAELNVPESELSRTIIICGKNDKVLEKISAKASEKGFVLRLGSIDTKSPVSLVTEKYAHAGCVDAKTETPGLKEIRLSEETKLIYREDMRSDRVLSALISFAEE